MGSPTHASSGSSSPDIPSRSGGSACFPRCFRDNVHNRIPCADAGWLSILTRQICLHFSLNLRRGPPNPRHPSLRHLPPLIVNMQHPGKKCSQLRLCRGQSVSTITASCHAKSPHRSTMLHLSLAQEGFEPAPPSPHPPDIQRRLARKRMRRQNSKFAALRTALHCSQSTRAPSLSRLSSAWSRSRRSRGAQEATGCCRQGSSSARHTCNSALQKIGREKPSA